MNGNKLTTQQQLTYYLGHELVHSVSGQQRTKLVNDIFAFGERYIQSDKLQETMDSKRTAYIRHLMQAEGMSRVEAEAEVDLAYVKEEVAGDLMGELLARRGGMARLAKENKGLAQRLRKLAADMADGMRRVRGEDAGARALRNEAEALVDRMDRALKDAGARDNMKAENAEQEERGTEPVLSPAKPEDQQDMKTVERDYTGANDTRYSMKEDRDNDQSRTGRVRRAGGEEGPHAGGKQAVSGAAAQVSGRNSVYGRSGRLKSDSSFGQQAKLSWAQGNVIIPAEGTVAYAEQQISMEYGVASFVISDEAWQANEKKAPAFTHQRQIYFKETMPEQHRGMLAIHELTHMMKQERFAPYLRFVDRVPGMLNRATSEAQMLLEMTAKHRQIDIFHENGYVSMSKLRKLSAKDKQTLYDEMNATLYGRIGADKLNDRMAKFVNAAFRDFDSYSRELTELHQQFKESRMGDGKAGVAFDPKTESVSPTRYSLKTWNASDYVQERKEAAADMAKNLGISQDKAMAYIDSVNSIAKMIADDRVRLDYEASPGRSSFVSNAEYGGSFDFSTLCKKRRLLTGTFTAIQKALPNTALTADEILEIRKMMADKGLEVSCGLCYVEGSRANMGGFTQAFIELYKKYNPGKWYPDMAEMNTPDGIEWVRINHPEVYKEYESFWNNHGKLRDGDPNLFASQQKPKPYQLHTEYQGEILQKFKNDGNVMKKNENGGVRLQSFSDFEIVHLLDTMQVITDMSRVGLAGQAYTKVSDFAWALGDTGLKINLSLIAKDVDADGKLIFDEREGMAIDEAMALRERYSENVGTIIVAFNDEQLKAAMADERIDFIIPFHRSQWKKKQYGAMGLPAKTKDYTYQQNEKLIQKTYHEYRGRMVPDKATNFMPNSYWDFSKTGKENAEHYLEMCAQNNKRPKFYKLLKNNGDGSYSLQPDGSTDGYWKLLIDFKMYNNDGVGVPQQPVRPDFNMEEAQRMLRDYTGGHARFPVAQGIVDEFVKKYKADNPGKRYSVDSSETGNKRNYDYENLVSKPDIVVAAIPMREIPTKGKRVDMPKITGSAREKANFLSGGDFGDQRYVIVKDLNEKVLVNSRGLSHGLTGNKTNSGTMSTAEVTYELPAILENSIAVNERETRTADDGEFGYVLFGYAEREDGQGYIVKSTVNHFADNKSVVDDVEIYNVLKGSKAKKVGSEEPTKGETAHGAATLETQRPVSPQSQPRTISVADMLDIVKDNYPELLPDSVREHFGITDASKKSGLRYSVDSDQDINPDTGYRRGSAMDSAMRIYNAGKRDEAKHKSTYRQFLTDDPSYQGGGAADKYEALKQVKSAVKARANEIMSDWLWKQDIEPIFKS